mgnify:CR=1 FL=1
MSMTRRPLPSSSLRASAPTCASSRRRSRFLTSACRTKIYPTRTSSRAPKIADASVVLAHSWGRSASSYGSHAPRRQGPARLVHRFRRLRRVQDPPANPWCVGHQGRRGRDIADLHVRWRLGLLHVLGAVLYPGPRLPRDDLRRRREVPVRVRRRPSPQLVFPPLHPPLLISTPP